MTQCERIMNYIYTFGSINPAQAMGDLGVYRLAARINDLRRQGYKIESKIVADRNRFGETVHHAVYRLVS